MKNWIKELLYIVKNYKTDQKLVFKKIDVNRKRLEERIKKAEKIIKDRTDISADIHLKSCSRNQIIVTGRYGFESIRFVSFCWNPL